MHIIRENFNSIQEMLKILNERENNNVMRDEYDSQEKNSPGWYGTKSYEEAEELITNGYTEILDKIKAGIKFDASENSKIIPENNVFGYIPNIPNAMMNLPKSMIYAKRIPRKITTIDLVYCPVGPGYTYTQEFIDNGIKVLNVINSLEKNNIRVNLKVALKCSEAGNEANLATVTLKNFKEKLNLQKICFPIAHPSMLRRFGFKWLETTPELTDHQWTSGYGRTTTNYSLFKTKEIIFGLSEIKNLKEEEIIQKVIKNNKKLCTS